MKKSFLTFCATALTLSTLFAQMPEAFNYQAVARDAGGDAITNTTVGVEFQLRQSTASGTVVYSETHSPTTNEHGLFSVAVGEGTPTVGTFPAIDWSAGPYYLEVGLDPNGGSSYISMGTQQLLSVPYALHAKTVEEGQQLSMNGDTIFLSNGNYIILPPRFTTNCQDGLLNGDETGVDCGGSACVDCATICSDGIQNGDETGVDCGGTTCVDCATLCSDGIQNGDETGVDCGGTSCVSCALVCGDGLQNFDETGIDCGGSICTDCCTADLDGDGWSPCDGDCDDGDPLVNPGAFDIVGNGKDDNCNGVIDETPSICSTNSDFFSVTADQQAEAMELCQFTTANPPLDQRVWGVIDASFRIPDGSVPSAPQLSKIQGFQTAIMTEYGTGGIVPNWGATFAGLSNGTMRDASDPGYLAPNTGSNYGYTGSPPADYLTAHGGTLPSTTSCNGTCVSGTGANDGVNLRLEIRVPTNASAFSYDYRFFTADYLSFSCGLYNDMHLALLTTTAPGNPADKNLAVDGSGNPITVNCDLMDICVNNGCHICPIGSGPLLGTGMDIGNTGAGTQWQTVTAPIVAGETIIIELMIFDVGDNIYNANVLFDNFRWISL